MRYVLDTNIMVALLRSGDPKIVEMINRVKIDSCCISDITLFELYCGAEYSSNPEREIARVESITSCLEILNTRRSAREAARQKAVLRANGNLIEDFDIMIAAAAIENGYTLVSRNVKHMSRIEGLKLEVW